MATYRKNKKNWKKLIFYSFVSGVYFGWLYKVDEARTSIKFLPILKYSIKGNIISNIFVLGDLSDFWWLSQKGKKKENTDFSIIFLLGHILDGSTRILKQNKSWIPTYLEVLWPELAKCLFYRDLSDSCGLHKKE